MTVSEEILKYVEARKKVWGGTLERELSTFHKPSTIGRACRSLVKEGKLEASYEQVNGQGAWCVIYELTSEGLKAYNGIYAINNKTINRRREVTLFNQDR